MLLKQPTVGDLILNPDKTFVIPPYQRGYQWNSDLWQNLIRDIADKVTGDDKNHWLGIVLTSLSDNQEEASRISYNHKYFDLIDGQQRITTLRVWLQALHDHVKERDGGRLIENEMKFAKIICQEADSAQLQVVLTPNAWRQHWKSYSANESGLIHAYTYFRWILWLGQDALLLSEPDPLPKKSKSENESTLPIEQQWELALERRRHTLEEANESNELQLNRSAEVDCQALIRATSEKLVLVELERQHLLDEDPAEIFETLNGKRTPLEQFDHVRNYIFTGIKDATKRTSLYESSWKSHELTLRNSNISARGSSSSENFLYDFLISQGETKFQKSFSKHRTARHFVKYAQGRTDGNLENVARHKLLPSMATWILISKKGEHFQIDGKNFKLPTESSRSLHMMDALSSGPVVPLVMRIVQKYIDGESSEESINRQLFWIETFLGRKVLRRLALSPLRSEMMQFVGKLNHNFSEDDLFEALKSISPTDNEIKDALSVKKINKIEQYDESAQIGHSKGLKPKQILAIFQAIESKRAGNLRTNLLESTSTERFSIEHIYPQEASNWRNELRAWNLSSSLMDKRLHVIGNLGVIPKRLNSKLSNASFSDKKLIISDPRQQFPNLKVNEYWTRQAQQKWTPEDIDTRGNQLINSALEYWKFD